MPEAEIGTLAESQTFVNLRLSLRNPADFLIAALKAHDIQQGGNYTQRAKQALLDSYSEGEVLQALAWLKEQLEGERPSVRLRIEEMLQQVELSLERGGKEAVRSRGRGERSRTDTPGTRSNTARSLLPRQSDEKEGLPRESNGDVPVVREDEQVGRLVGGLDFFGASD